MSFDDVAAFPLCWPQGWPRTDRARRASGSKFGNWTVYTATEGLKEELRLLGCREIIVSTSVPLRRDGFPLSKPPVDGDPGVAVYFARGKKSQCVAIDTYAFVEFNLRAITLTIEAMRAIERHGGAEILDRAFTGFAALPAPEAPEPWYIVFGVDKGSSIDAVKARYRELVKTAHPDAGGSNESMWRLQQALESFEAERELGR